MRFARSMADLEKNVGSGGIADGNWGDFFKGMGSTLNPMRKLGNRHKARTRMEKYGRISTYVGAAILIAGLAFGYKYWRKSLAEDIRKERDTYHMRDKA